MVRGHPKPRSKGRRAWETTKKFGKRAAVTGALVGAGAMGGIIGHAIEHPTPARRLVNEAQLIRGSRIPSNPRKALAELKNVHIFTLLPPAQRTEFIEILRNDATRIFDEEAKYTDRSRKSLAVLGIQDLEDFYNKEYGKDMARQYFSLARERAILSQVVNDLTFEFRSNFAKDPRVLQLASSIPQERLDHIEKGMAQYLVAYKKGAKKWTWNGAIGMAGLLAFVAVARKIRRKRE